MEPLSGTGTRTDRVFTRTAVCMVRDPKGHLNWVRLPFSTFVRRGQRFVGFVFPLFFGANRAWQEYIYIYT